MTSSLDKDNHAQGNTSDERHNRIYLNKRSKSAINIPLLKRSQSRAVDEDDATRLAGMSTASLLASLPAIAQQNTNMSSVNTPSSSSGHIRAQSQNMAGLARAPSAQTPVKASTSAHAPSLSEKGLSIEQSVRKFRIFEALRNGDTASISKAIRDTTDVSRQSTSSISNTGGPLEDTTILHLAIQCAEPPVIEYVLSEGSGYIDINSKDREGNTPLHVAASQGRGHIVRLLLEQKGINDSITNYAGKLPLDMAKTPDIFQQLTLSRSLFMDSKIKEIQGLIASGDYDTLGNVLEDPRVKIVLDINGGEFASDITTVQSGGTLLHEAARKKDTQLIQMLLLHGADPFRRDRRGKLPQDVTKDESTRAMLKKSPAAVAAQRGIQEKAVLGNSNPQGVVSSAQGDGLGAKESREMKGYLKKWTNYRKGYQLRWFVLEDGVLSYYKHQDDAGTACRGAINSRIAKLHMDPTEKTKFEIIGKSSVKYSLKANHEVEAKRWFWALNNSIQWAKDQAKQEEQQQAKHAEILRHAKAEQAGKGDLSVDTTDNTRRNSAQSSRLIPQSSSVSRKGVAFEGSASGSVADEAEGTAYGSYEPSYMGDLPMRLNAATTVDGDNDDDYDDGDSSQMAPASKDAFGITAQSAKMQIEMMTQVHAAIQAEQHKNPNLIISDPSLVQAVSTFDSSIQNLKGLLSNLVKISKDRDSYWQSRLDREADMRRMWEDSMAQVAREHEVLEARVGEAEEKRKKTKKALRELIVNSSQPQTPAADNLESAVDAIETAPDGTAIRRASMPYSPSVRRKSILAEAVNLDLSDDESEDEEEFFDAVDAGQVEVAAMPPVSPPAVDVKSPVVEKQLSLVPSNQFDLSDSYKGYEDGIRKRLKMDADDRPKISLWGILKSMIGKDMTKMTLPVSFNEPTSLLQRCAEDMEYADLLDVAAERMDSAERMVYVAAFAASEYASTIGRVAKPFNPLLGETYEYVRPDKQYRFFIEQVSHHPPIGAAYAESPRWTYFGESAVKSKFYGKSFDINPLGTWFLRLRSTAGGPEELYTWKKVTSSVIGIITGNPTVDNYGKMEVKNHTTGEVSIIDFKPRGWTASSAYQISGRVNDASGKTRFSIGGHWNSKIYARLTPGFEAPVAEPKSGRDHHRGSISSPDQVFLVWEANPRPTGIPFNLTPFVVTLNDIPDKLRAWLPPTDTRLRPDQRAMEDGEYDFAATEKNRVEEKQRRARREREQRGEEWKPVWFEKDRDSVTGEEYWRFNGRYWDERSRREWKGVPDIF